MLGTALADPIRCASRARSVVQQQGELPDDAGPVDIDKAAIRRAGGTSRSSPTAGRLPPLAAARELAGRGIDAEVIDLRTLGPLDDATFVDSVHHTHRAVIVDEGWRGGSISAEISAQLSLEQAFYGLDAPIGRVCSRKCARRYARHGTGGVPSAEDVVRAAGQPARG